MSRQREAGQLTQIAFYHLQAVALETALPQLLTKCLERDLRAVVQVGDPDRLRALDEHLWTFDDTSFLPHASSLDAIAYQVARQPIWLCHGTDNPNGAKARFFVEGAEPQEDQSLADYERVLVLFDGRKELAVGQARSLWKRLRAAGQVLSYWKQSQSGSWQRADS